MNNDNGYTETVKGIITKYRIGNRHLIINRIEMILKWRNIGIIVHARGLPSLEHSDFWRCFQGYIRRFGGLSAH